jgi:hypothetical protein
MYLGGPFQCTEGQFAKYTYSYAPPVKAWDGGEMATMNMARSKETNNEKVLHTC